METQKFMGRNQLVKRLIAQVGDKGFAYALLKKRGHMNPDGTLTAEGQQRNEMTAGERAHDRAGTTPSTHTYDSTTNKVKKN